MKVLMAFVIIENDWPNSSDEVVLLFMMHILWMVCTLQICGEFAVHRKSVRCIYMNNKEPKTFRCIIFSAEQ